MSTPAHKREDRVLEFSPFEPGQEFAGVAKEIPGAGPAYGCVEWFHYFEHSAPTPGSPATAPRQGCARRS